MEVKNLVWLSFDEAKPTDESVILVRGEYEGNGPEAEGEFYVFCTENGEFTTDTGKPIKENGLFKGYKFTHWALIPEPTIRR